MEKQRFCRKCLLREMKESEYFQNMYEYIAGLPAEDKVSDEVYEMRLGICKECENLLNGMCRICGCYVEMRASMKVKGCPEVNPLWNAVGKER
ncbi:MAG: DUF6171 family protein [Lachnospiraceae bacterium]|jgi:hypothetical protein|nr:DUF6171 family protein [Lachnospiraceae bacterium]MDD3616067.1 DUF6171 family protein [Lachnospiraceae bacterium]